MHKETLPLVLFTLLSLILYLINFPFEAVMLSSILSWTWIVLAVYVVYLLYRYKNILLTIFLLVNIVVQVYFLFVYFYYDKIVPSGPFDFSAYRLDYIQEGSNLLFLVFFVMVMVWLFKKNTIFIHRSKGMQFKLDHLLLPIKKIKTQKVVVFLIVFFFIDIIVYLTTTTILQAPYSITNKRMDLINVPDSLRAFLVMPFLFAYFVMKVKDGFRNTIRVVLFKILFFLSLYSILLLYGTRGAATGLVTMMMFFDLFTDRKNMVKMFNFALALWLLYVMIFLWPIMRFSIYSMGFADAFWDAWNKMLDIQVDFYSVQFNLIPMIPMTLFHFLYTIDLIHRDLGLDYQTFIKLIPQQMPEFLANAIGYERPINDNILLSNYFVHGGGFYIFANAYWNGGVTPLVLFAALISWVLVKIEVFFKQVKDPLYFLAYPIFMFLLPVNTLYGIQSFVRGLEFGAVTLLIIYIYRRVRIKRR